MATKGVFDRLVNSGLMMIDETTSTISTEVQDPSGNPSNKVIRVSDLWQVRFDWSIGGFLPNLWALLGVPPTGKFVLEVDAEYLGNEIMCGTLTVPAATGTWNGSTLNFAARIVPVPAGVISKEGVYRIVKHLRYTNPVPAFKTAAFVEGEDIEFF